MLAEAHPPQMGRSDQNEPTCTLMQRMQAPLLLEFYSVFLLS